MPTMPPEPLRPQSPSSKSEHEGPNDDGSDMARIPSTDPIFDEKDLARIPFKKQDSSFLNVDSLRSLTASPCSVPGGHAHTPARGLSPRPPPSSSTYASVVVRQWRSFWSKNRSILLVALSQFFGALMNLAARLLELEGEGMHPFQILFFRQGMTAILASVYMYWTRVPEFPLGSKEVRLLLIARGLTGFFGIYGMWYSIMYLPLAEATVITFLAPSLAGYVCHLVPGLRDPFTRKEQIGSLLALGGVILIARPTSLFGSGTPGNPSSTVPLEVSANLTEVLPHLGEGPSPTQRLGAIGMALLGVLGSAGAFTTIRWIGKRAHPLISVNYFATCCTIVSITVLSAAPLLDIGQPAIRFAAPTSARQWFLLLFLGTCGFVMQCTLTAGLGSERSNRATAMVYTHMLFAAGFDRWVFGHQMGIVSLVGCGLIIGSALWVALTKKEQGQGERSADVELGALPGAESVPMLRDADLDDDETDENVTLEDLS